MNDLDYKIEISSSRKKLQCDLCMKQVDLLHGVLSRDSYRQVCTDCYISEADRP